MNLKSSLESILFVRGEPLTVAALSKIAGSNKSEVLAALKELSVEYHDRGIRLVENNEEWQLVTNPMNKEVVERLVSSELSDELSRAALEVLAIIAYKGPVSRAKIEYIRGVNSSFTVRNLLIRGLIEREGNPEDKRSYVYRVATDFLKHVGVTHIRELPGFEELSKTTIEIPEPSAE